MKNLANVYWSQGKFAEAAALYRDTFDIRRRVLGAEHPDTLLSMGNLADTYTKEGKFPQAEALFTQTMTIARRVLGPEHPETLAFAADFGAMYQRGGDYGQAETLAAQVLAGRRRALGSEHYDTMPSAPALALAYLSQGKFAKSQTLAREAMEANRKLQPDSWQRFRAESLLGASLAGQEKYREAEPLLLEGYAGMLARKDQIEDPDAYHTELAHQWVIELYQAWDKPEKVAQWRQK